MITFYFLLEVIVSLRHPIRWHHANPVVTARIFLSGQYRIIISKTYAFQWHPYDKHKWFVTEYYAYLKAVPLSIAFCALGTTLASNTPWTAPVLSVRMMYDLSTLLPVEVFSVTIGPMLWILTLLFVVLVFNSGRVTNWCSFRVDYKERREEYILYGIEYSYINKCGHWQCLLQNM